MGDSLGMVVLGYPDTTEVLMSDMVHHVEAAARAEPSALLVGDMPFASYRDPEEALRNARHIGNLANEERLLSNALAGCERDMKRYFEKRLEWEVKRRGL